MKIKKAKHKNRADRILELLCLGIIYIFGGIMIIISTGSIGYLLFAILMK